MSAPLLTFQEAYRPGIMATRNYSDLWLLRDMLNDLTVAANLEVAGLARQGRTDVPKWVLLVWEYQCDRRDSIATMRDLRSLVKSD